MLITSAKTTKQYRSDDVTVNIHQSRVSAYILKQSGSRGVHDYKRNSRTITMSVRDLIAFYESKVKGKGGKVAENGATRSGRASTDDSALASAKRMMAELAKSGLILLPDNERMKMSAERDRMPRQEDGNDDEHHMAKYAENVPEYAAFSDNVIDKNREHLQNSEKIGQ